MGQVRDFGYVRRGRGGAGRGGAERSCGETKKKWGAGKQRLKRGRSLILMRCCDSRAFPFLSFPPGDLRHRVRRQASLPE